MSVKGSERSQSNEPAKSSSGTQGCHSIIGAAPCLASVFANSDTYLMFESFSNAVMSLSICG